MVFEFGQASRVSHTNTVQVFGRGRVESWRLLATDSVDQRFQGIDVLYLYLGQPEFDCANKERERAENF